MSLHLHHVTSHLPTLGYCFSRSTDHNVFMVIPGPHLIHLINKIFFYLMLNTIFDLIVFNRIKYLIVCFKKNKSFNFYLNFETLNF